MIVYLAAREKAFPVERGAVLTSDRQCKACGTRYLTVPAPISGAVQAAMYVSGVVLILGGVLAAVLQLAASFPLYRVFLCVIFSVPMGVKELGLPAQIQQEREKRLKQYQASAPPGAPPLVEIPRPPDMVLVSGQFGILALVAPLVSSLLTVVVFGPAAVVCGAVALSQGHLKGLIGFLLGAAGLIVWGLVFVYFFQR
jgi:uncharacterized membrane protein HdeD (DUF308 family)